MYNTRQSPFKPNKPVLPEGEKVKRPLTCPFCRNGKSVIAAPDNTELLYWCDDHGGTCPKTCYMLVRIESGGMQPQVEAFRIMYEALTGCDWDGNGLSPNVEFHLDSFLTDGYLTEEMPADPDDFWGVMFMRLSQVSTD